MHSIHKRVRMTLRKSIMTHPRWGKILVTRNPRARHIIMRARPDAIHITVPPLATNSDIEKALDKCGEKLLKAREKSEKHAIDVGYSIEAPSFTLGLIEHPMLDIRIAGRDGAYTILCPQGTDYSCETVQQTLRDAVKAAMKHCAGIVLPERLKNLAQEHHFSYNSCTVRDVRTRWGSCNTRGNISLNIQLVLLPQRLIDYVLLHELCHTVEMNHSARFWALLDRCTAPARAKELRDELKKAGKMI